MNSKQTKTALQKAQSEYYAIEQERTQFIDDKMVAVHAEFDRQKRNVITEASNKFEAKMRDLNVALNRAREQHETTIVAERTANTGWLPVGTKVVLWDYRYGGWSSTGFKGIVDVWTSDSDSPDNVGQWSLPSFGDVYVRLLKADGTPSKKFSRQHARWFAEGVTPPKEKVKA